MMPMTGTSVPRNHNQPINTKGIVRRVRHARNDSAATARAAAITRSTGGWESGYRNARLAGQKSSARYLPYDRIALPSRIGNGTSSNEATATRCTSTVTTLDATASANSGSFSASRRVKGTDERLSGHTSSNSNVAGKVTNIGLAIKPSANSKSTAA